MGDHTAAASAIGYAYQTQWAFLELLRQEKSRSDQEMTLELHDDVAFGNGKDALKLLQLKHHIKANAGHMSDKSVDVWKTLTVWLEAPKLVDVQGPALVLVTTSTAEPGMATWHLRRSGDRDPQLAAELLTSAAKASKSKTTEKGRKLWRELSEHERVAFCERILVADGAITIDEIEGEVESLLRAALPTDLLKKESFLAQVWRWWNRVSLDLLTKRRSSVNAMDAYAHIEQIRNTFANDDLPTTIHLADIDEVELFNEHDSRTFVHQLRLVGAGRTTLQKAVVDYYRAVTQETRWLTNSLVDLAELQDFEDKIVDEWERAHGAMIEDLGDEEDEALLARHGLELFRQVTESPIRIRRHYSEEFHGRGKRHELAEKQAIGWHPDFIARIAALTAEKAS